MDGIFLDTVSCQIEDLCPKWHCTQTEYDQLFNSSLEMVEAAVIKLKSMNKLVSVSTHVDMYYIPDYYWKYRQILKNNDNTIRYWEGLEASFGSSFYNHFITFLNETADNISQHVHAGIICKLY